MAAVERAVRDLEKIDTREVEEHRRVWNQRNLQYRTVDKSVRETLQKVIQFEPFPASFRESQRTFNIDFNLKAKRTTG